MAWTLKRYAMTTPYQFDIAITIHIAGIERYHVSQYVSIVVSSKMLITVVL
tara:strand:+ start:1223 stop:1375 length:153 start_codon:yes stop_codon:yes gene_type:complete